LETRTGDQKVGRPALGWAFDGGPGSAIKCRKRTYVKGVSDFPSDHNPFGQSPEIWGPKEMGTKKEGSWEIIWQYNASKQEHDPYDGLWLKTKDHNGSNKTADRQLEERKKRATLGGQNPENQRKWANCGRKKNSRG